MFTRTLLLLIFLLSAFAMNAQTCTNLGQNPGTAFPVCGSTSFNQSTVDICGARIIPSQCPSNAGLFQDKNPYWYSFTCYTPGTLGFVITPTNLDDDYDWQLFDVTGADPAEVYTNDALFVACNWSGESGKTGSSAAGTSFVNCAGFGVPLYSKMPTLVAGHKYLLLVSHFTDSQSGYSLSFTGGAATITDTTIARLQTAKSSCDGKRISIKINKKMKCRSLAGNGSDFSVSDPTVKVVFAAGINCTSSFDMDSLIVTLDNPLPPGNYKVYLKKGTDLNTLLDNCNDPMPEGDSLSFSVFPSQPAALDSIINPGCAPGELQLTLSTPIKCNSVAADGSDFSLSGTSPAVVTGAAGTCTNGVSTIIKLTLSQPIYSAGVHQVTLNKGSDGNTIFTECDVETNAGAAVSFTTKDTVSATFVINTYYGCRGDTVAFFNNGEVGITQWKWHFNKTDSSDLQNPVYIYKNYGEQQVKLFVSNGVCADSASAGFTLDNELKAIFTAPKQLCPNDLGSFRDTSIGKIVSWAWNFGNGGTSNEKNPPSQIFPISTANKDYFVRLIVKDQHDCFDTAYTPVKVLYNCYIAVASAFTPNGDNLNDYLYPVNAWKARNLIFRVYNRLGQLVFQTTDFTNKWDGTVDGIKQQTGTYVWTLQYVHEDTGQRFFLKGTTVLIR